METRSSPRFAVPAWIGLALCLATAGSAGTPVYSWTDAAGHVHATGDLREVPPQYRPAALDRARAAAPSRLQTFRAGAGAVASRRDGPPHPPSSAPPPAPSAAVARTDGTLRVPFERRGTLMIVDVVLNDHVRAPFLVDTGASGVSIPAALVEQLGIRIDADTPRLQVQTAAGIVSEPWIRLDAVQLGAARVEHLDALVNSSMDLGLLGGSFFNNFVYQVDAVAQVITLRPNEGVRGGLTASEWRERFRAMSDDVERLESYLERTELASDPRRNDLERNLASVRDALDELHRVANAARVPRAWRE